MQHKFNTSVNEAGTIKRANLDETFEGLDDGSLDDDGLIDIANKRRSYYDEREDNDDFFGGGLF